MVDVWTLIKNDSFEQACEEADKEYLETGHIFPLRNKLYALLHLRKYQEAIDLANRLLASSEGRSDAEFLFLGVANWCLNKKEEAVEEWSKAASTIYTDATGGVEMYIYCYFAAIRMDNAILKNHALRSIKKKLRNKASGNWPGPVAAFLIGNISSEELFSCVSKGPILKVRNLCQAYFAMAIKELELQNEEGHMSLLQRCVELGSNAYLEMEYYLAKGELEQRSSQ